MRSTKKLLSAAVATVGLATFATAAPAAAAHNPEDQMTKVFRFDTGALNDSGVTAGGEVYLTRTTVAVQGMTVNGLTPSGAPHAQMLHGTPGVRNACPTIAADTDGDGFVSTPEGAPSYGAVQTSLTTSGDTSPSSALAVERMPAGDGSGSYTYERIISVPPEVAWYLGSLHVVVHGRDINGSGDYDMAPGASPLNPDLPFEATIPVTCGQLNLVQVDLPPAYDGASGEQGEIARLYALMLNREPDASGFQYWIDVLGDRANLYGVAGAFLQSQEFTQRFGDRLNNATDAEWVDFVYQATLGRSADDAGRQYWLSELASPRLDRIGMLVSFSESQEFQTLTSTS